MRCPKCNINLQMTDKQGIEIDYCPQCRGVWLDRGELDKIIERSSSPAAYQGAYGQQPSYPPVPQYYNNQQPYRRYDDDDDDWDADDYHKRNYGQPGYDPNYRRRKKGFLGDLFDF